MIIWAGHDYPTGNSSKREMKRQTEQMMGKQHQRVNWPSVEYTTTESLEPGGVEEAGCKIYSGAPTVSVSAQDGIIALGKAHTCSAPSLSSLPKVALETVPIFVWLNTDRSRPWRVECQPLPFSTPLSFRRSML